MVFTGPNHHGHQESSCKVKNTFLEFGKAEDNEFIRGRRARSDVVPGGAVHPDQVNGYTGGVGEEEPAYVMPGTPSPMMQSQFAPCGMMPSLDGFNLGDMWLPPAFGEGMGDGSANPFDMNAMPYMTGVYDPNFQPFLYYDAFQEGMTMEGFALEGVDVEEQGNAPSAEGSGIVVPPPNEEWARASNESSKKEPVVVPPKEDWRSTPGSRRKSGAVTEKPSWSLVVEEQEWAEAKVDRTPVAEQAPEAASPKNSCDAVAPSGATDGCTTVMLRNVPNKYTREMLVKQLNKDFSGRFDFLYLPIDFKNKCNVGYGFINFRTPAACSEFVGQFHGVDVRKCLPGLNSKKIVEVTPARVQGLVENVRRLRNSPVMNQLADHPEWMPLLFDDNGNNEAFPDPDQAVPRVKPRGRGRDSLAW